MKKKIYFKSRGVDICGILNVPKNRKLRDFCIVFCHGWDTSKDKSSKVRNLTGRLAESCVNSFAFDFFGHGESGGSRPDITQTIAVENVNDAINMLRKKGFRRFAIVGSSFGGGTAIAYASKFNGLEFLVLFSPLTKYGTANLRKYFKKQGVKIGFVLDAKEYDFYKLAGRIRTPTVIIQGSKDLTTPIAGARKVFRLINAEKMMVIIEGADHHYSKMKHRKDSLNAAFNYILYNLPKH